MDTIGVGLIGTGFMGKAHALAWNSVRPVFGDVPAIRLVHLGEANDELAQRKAAEFGFEKASGDWRKVIADPEVDVVSITTPNKFHLEMAKAALAAGKHVWCEKPMAPKLAEAEEMLAAARASGKAAVLGYNYIQNPAIRHISKLLDEGVIGPVNHVRIEMDEDFLADPEAPFQQRHEAINGWGALDDFGVHPLSLLYTLFGQGQPRHVRHGQTLPDPQDARGRPRGRGVRHRHHHAPPRKWSIGLCRGQPHRLGAQGPHRHPDFRWQGLDPLRPGADERAAALRHLGPRHRARLPHRADGAASSALRPLHPRRRPQSRLQRSEDHRMPAADRAHARPTKRLDRLRGRHI